MQVKNTLRSCKICIRARLLVRCDCWQSCCFVCWANISVVAKAQIFTLRGDWTANCSERMQLDKALLHLLDSLETTSTDGDASLLSLYYRYHSTTEFRFEFDCWLTAFFYFTDISLLSTSVLNLIADDLYQLFNWKMVPFVLLCRVESGLSWSQTGPTREVLVDYATFIGISLMTEGTWWL